MKISGTDLIMLIAQYENSHMTFLFPFYYTLSNYVTILSAS